MTFPRLATALGYLSDDVLNEALDIANRPAKPKFKIGMVIAACLVIAVSVVGRITYNVIQGYLPVTQSDEYQEIALSDAYKLMPMGNLLPRYWINGYYPSEKVIIYEKSEEKVMEMQLNSADDDKSIMIEISSKGFFENEIESINVGYNEFIYDDEKLLIFVEYDGNVARYTFEVADDIGIDEIKEMIYSCKAFIEMEGDNE